MLRTVQRAAAGLLCLLLILGAGTADTQEPPGFVPREQARPLPDVAFEDTTGATLRLADFRGKVVLLNLWATWCAPCRREMPTLDRLQAKLGGADFHVLALSMDREGLLVVRQFYEELGLAALDIHVDASGRASRTLRAPGLPTTLVLDRQGRELGRLLGPAQWDSPNMVAFFRSLIEQSPDAVERPRATQLLLDTAATSPR